MYYSSKEIEETIQTKINLQALGNSKREPKDIAADLVNASNMDYEDIAAGCYLCKQTIIRLANGKTKDPQSSTITRVFRFFNMKMSLEGEVVKAKYLNKPK